MSIDPRRARARAAAQPAQPTPPPPPPPPAEPEPSEFSSNLDGAGDAPPHHNGDVKDETAGYKLRFCTVCASNNNRYDQPNGRYLAKQD